MATDLRASTSAAAPSAFADELAGRDGAVGPERWSEGRDLVGRNLERNLVVRDHAVSALGGNAYRRNLSLEGAAFDTPSAPASRFR